jgi:hypothetical protein
MEFNEIKNDKGIVIYSKNNANKEVYTNVHSDILEFQENINQTLDFLSQSIEEIKINKAIPEEDIKLLYLIDKSLRSATARIILIARLNLVQLINKMEE